MAKSKNAAPSTIALNKKAKHDYYFEERYEAGVALHGWEVKSLREGRLQLRDSYVLLKDGEAFLFGALITPLPSASSHIVADPLRTRKLLLHRQELAKLFNAIDRKGYTAVVTAIYWKQGRAKVEVALAKGKQEHDKRDVLKDKDWQREKERYMKHSGR
jgi:SsrA-binding protein